jgi:hypothetical protein
VASVLLHIFAGNRNRPPDAPEFKFHVQLFLLLGF